VSTSTSLSNDCRGELAIILGADHARLVANGFDAVLAFVDHHPEVLPYSNAARLRAADALAECIACIEDHPQIAHSLSTLSQWRAWNVSAPLILTKLNEGPIEITVSELDDQGKWRPVGPKAKAKAGRPKEDRRDAVGVVLATAFRCANIVPTRRRAEGFARAYEAVCRHLCLSPPARARRSHGTRHRARLATAWNLATLDACIHRSQRLYGDVRCRAITAAGNARMDHALRRVRLEPKSGAKVRT